MFLIMNIFETISIRFCDAVTASQGVKGFQQKIQIVQRAI